MRLVIQKFSPVARVFHWLMAALIGAQLFMGVGMAGSTSPRYASLLGWHKPVGLAILVLALLRLAYRLRHTPPPLPSDLPSVQKLAAQWSHYALYALMLLMPLIGWAMLSAAPYPILVGGWHVPALLHPDPVLYAGLRQMHGVLGYAFYLLVLVHLGAALMHALIRRDGVFQSMAGGDNP
jgi:cytochrome b561